MTLNRWWHAAVFSMAAALLAILLLTVTDPGRLALGLGALTLFVLSWLLLARRAFEHTDPVCASRGFAENRAALTLMTAIIVAAGLGTAAYPSFATVQCIAFPLMWILSSSIRSTMIANVALALTVGAGYLLSEEMGPGSLLSIAATVALSFGFSMAMGFWITRIMTASEERQSLLTELEAAQAQLAAASREAGTVAERARFTREIHDTIAQDLTGLIMLAGQARREPDAAARDRQLAQLEEAAREALVETRSLVAAGTPASLDQGLSAALERLGARFGRDSGIAVSVTATPAPGLDRDAEVVLLRCTQEALANVRKHSGARTSRVALLGHTLTISDDGHGFDPAVAGQGGGVGLGGMRDRLTLAGGRLDIASGAEGTTLTVTLAEAPQ